MITKSERNNLILSIVSVGSLAVALLLNLFRAEWFGVIKGYAPHNAGFNFLYFFPLIFLHFITALISLIWLLLKWDSRQNKRIKRITFVLILPSMIFFIISIAKIISILRIN